MTDTMSLSAEALAGVTGLFQVDPASRAQGKDAVSIPKAWKEGAVKFITQDKAKKFAMPRPSDHMRMLEKLAAGVDDERRVALVSQLQDPDLGEAYLTVLARAISYLRSRWPSLTLDTPAGPRPLPPGRVETGRAASLLSVLDDPCRVVDELRMMSLTHEQADAFRECYPELYAMLRSMLWDEISKQAADDKNWNLPRDKTQRLRIFLGMPMDAPLARTPQPPAKSAPPVPRVDVDFKSLATRSVQMTSGQ